MYMDRERTPLVEALLAYKNNAAKSFHVPGHKNGKAYDGINGAEQLSEVMKIDVTEISGTDDLHHPEGVIREAQELAADCFGAEESFFLVGGSTAGNLAMILTVCIQPGDLLLLQRNVHKSVLNGLMLAGARAVFLEPQMDECSGLAVIPSSESLRSALAANPETKGVFVTSPNYYGMGNNLRELADLCHKHEVPLLVDEAHGAHYGMHPDLPESALSCGADGVVQSTHKMLAAMTMGSMLHVQGCLLDRSLLRQRLAMVQSSSPSYPVMASLDLARRMLHAQGPSAFTAGLAAVGALRRGLAELPRFGLLQPPQPANPAASSAAGGQALPLQTQAAAYTRQDPFKAVIYDRTGSLSGYGLQHALEARGCVPEMSDERYVVLLLTLGSTLEDVNHLLWALRHIVEEEEASEPLEVFNPLPSEQSNVSTWNIPETTLLFSEPVTFSLTPKDPEQMESVPVEYSAERISAEMIIPYPPGIPILYPGELITKNTAERLVALRNAGAKCQGAGDQSLKTILVHKNSRKQGTI
ncbi:Arginine/lysine/ornithine decarboxylase [Paenibacillus uliginis N3/975]|uniref:Arginine/lysine/ornithine decarboxylase n=1 Tax=Paenibacillus uliginis N3/975 TaxID=1313296 RepID=A0A1X7HVJ6_9BACL|nr:aminotransferase class I/II-fold pyridoxal phosphate-dependent enzyme [Paenibacillus uliginis]SMF92742.1 Arginine/lysine/ornithine decarboxylase [Paenibacillus uliginis N3/975]